MAREEGQRVADADSQTREESGQPLLIPGGFVDEIRVEEALVDQSGLDQAERRAQQQDRRPSAAGSPDRLADHHRDRAVERGEEEQAGQQFQRTAHELEVADEVFGADRGQHQQSDRRREPVPR
ncbi:hypothetical protein GCM10010439_59690 [Actinocorallia aurantiaca]|uniref:Uncharacterized protein n=1 Tax=Actinocorallia aurantiaca TaxID=46204 RepID=A0ABN3UMW3_9ACTN